MRVSDLFPSRYVKAGDVIEPQLVAIRELQVEEIGQGKDAESKPVLYFHNRQKGLVLNVTNARTIEDAYGIETDAWPGKSIELFSTKVDFKGDRVDAVRVRVPKEASADELLDETPPRPKRSEPADQVSNDSTDPVEELNDEVPF
jgi:hypothetical protein